MDKVVIDTNVFISGLLFGGNPEKIIQKWIKKEFILCISPQLQAEIVMKLQNKFDASDVFISQLLIAFDMYAKHYIPQNTLTLVRDPKDNFLLELAEEASANYIITGDNDLLSLKKFTLTQIITPAAYLQI